MLRAVEVELQISDNSTGPRKLSHSRLTSRSWSRRNFSDRLKECMCATAGTETPCSVLRLINALRKITLPKGVCLAANESYHQPQSPPHGPPLCALFLYGFLHRPPIPCRAEAAGLDMTSDVDVTLSRFQLGRAGFRRCRTSALPPGLRNL
jgi:hypothetical protein